MSDDATMEIKVHVTRADIKHGQRKDCYTCPVARALRRLFPRADQLYVLSTNAFLKQNPDDDYLWAKLSRRAQAFVGKFDGGSRELKPRVFKLRFEPLNNKAA